MWAVIQLLLVGVVADGLRRRWSALAGFDGLPGYLLALGVTLFFAAWMNFALYCALGWGASYTVASWAGLAGAVMWSRRGGVGGGENARKWRLSFGEGVAFGFLLLLVAGRYCFAFHNDDEGSLWFRFNFLDTAFHLSVANAFLRAPSFPPVDLDMAPNPLKYHFIADFFLAHLVRLGLSVFSGLWCMNIVSSVVLTGAIWAAFKRWLRLPPAWVLLAALIFLFLNTALVNLAHFVIFNPPFFSAQDPMQGIVGFHYFNFESILTNQFEPQRALLFSFPVILLILHIVYGDSDRAIPAAGDYGGGLIAAFCLLCLLPFGHIVGFSVLSMMLLRPLWLARREFFARWMWWSPALALGLVQLWYVLYHGPPANPGFAGWDARQSIPLHDFQTFPEWSWRILFWIFVNGDFFLWGTAFMAMAVRTGIRSSLPEGLEALRGFVRRWAWYLVISAGFFLLINFYRYTFFWGDSNKFVLFLNLGLALVITLGAARWRGGDGRAFSRVLWLFFFVLCAGKGVHVLYYDLAVLEPARSRLFIPQERKAADWLSANCKDDDVVLTSAFNTWHFVTALGGARTRAGIYGDFNPHRPQGLRDAIRKVYEEDDFTKLEELGVRYVCVSRGEWRKYKLHDNWVRRAERGEGVVFAAPAENPTESVFIIDWRRVDRAAPNGP